jgi:hypothetical protein
LGSIAGLARLGVKNPDSLAGAGVRPRTIDV